MPKVSYEIGALVDFRLTDRLSIQSGMRYADWGYSTDKSRLQFSISDPSLPEYISSKSQNRYVEIPLRLNYHIPIGKYRLYLMGGWFPSYNLSNNVVTKTYYADRTETMRVEDDPINYEYRTINMIGEFGFGIEKMFSEKFGVTVGPTIRTQSFTIIEEAPLNRVLFFYGLSVGFVFK